MEKPVKQEADLMTKQSGEIVTPARAAEPSVTDGNVFTSGHAIQSRSFEAPRSSEEKTIAEIWEELLEVESIGVHDNFLLLGGESLLATQVVTRLREAFGVDVSVRSVFLGTIAEIAEEVARSKKTVG